MIETVLGMIVRMEKVIGMMMRRKVIGMMMRRKVLVLEMSTVMKIVVIKKRIFRKGFL